MLSDYIPASERVVVIEDSAELQIRGIPNLVRMEARSANAQGKGAVPIRQLIRTSLRQRPDRILVGEVRGEEVVDMLAAMSTGHAGLTSRPHNKVLVSVEIPTKNGTLVRFSKTQKSAYKNDVKSTTRTRRANISTT